MCCSDNCGYLRALTLISAFVNADGHGPPGIERPGDLPH